MTGVLERYHRLSDWHRLKPGQCCLCGAGPAGIIDHALHTHGPGRDQHMAAYLAMKLDSFSAGATVELSVLRHAAWMLRDLLARETRR